MSVNFQPRGGSSYDAITGISIPLPRMLPATLPDGRNVIEFQYAFLRGSERVGGLGIFGAESMLQESDRPVWLYKIELTQESAFLSLRHLSEAIGGVKVDFEFIQAVAQGLVNVFAERRTYSEDQRNVVLTTVEALLREAVSIPASAVILPDGSIPLAEVRVCAQAG